VVRGRFFHAFGLEKQLHLRLEEGCCRLSIFERLKDLPFLALAGAPASISGEFLEVESGGQTIAKSNLCRKPNECPAFMDEFFVSVLDLIWCRRWFMALPLSCKRIYRAHRDSINERLNNIKMVA